jgi:hypothetical protein
VFDPQSRAAAVTDYRPARLCEIFATVAIFLNRATVQSQLFVSMSHNNNRGAVMSITALLLVLLLPFAVGAFLHRSQAARKMRWFS